MPTKIEPITDCVRSGFEAIGHRRHRGRKVVEVLGTFKTWQEADKACDAYHAAHKSTDLCEIKPVYEPEGNG